MALERYSPEELTRLRHLLEYGDDLLNVTDNLDVRVTALEDGQRADGIYCNTTEYWRQHSDFIPAKGDIVIYSDHATVNNQHVPAFKVGDGLAYGIDLPFSGDDIRAALTAHIGNTSIHLSTEDRTKLNESVTCEEELLEDGSYRLAFSNTN